MSHTPHELAEEFPHAADAMHRLKQEDAHFAKLFDSYHEVNRAIHRAETNIEPVAEAQEAQMRRERMALKDEIAHILNAA
ncbi:hypothetical protein ROE7235_02905 [Roseibaca ekhonensis]|uniref:DUF465 domain-containing protein n=1 Tax=Roseinatronobacter ekhonensis TaxID=254356 RepID=A0A3B0MQ53_9RHOB|nr:YdcH family protein [Roseibaca ekhonensis]SUZ33137.1 hypothetical protein ROE7235_02905 [Roseibaca ekhonensis]